VDGVDGGGGFFLVHSFDTAPADYAVVDVFEVEFDGAGDLADADVDDVEEVERDKGLGGFGLDIVDEEVGKLLVF